MTDAGDESKWAALVGDNEEGDGDDDDDDDVHVCGGCKEQFSKVEVFVAHKRECKAKRRRKADANSRVSVIVDLGKEVTISSSLNLS